jgi:hypothetical protein
MEMAFYHVIPLMINQQVSLNLPSPSHELNRSLRTRLSSVFDVSQSPVNKSNPLLNVLDRQVFFFAIGVHFAR